MDPVAIVGVLVAVVGVIVGKPSGLAALKQLRSRKLAEQAPSTEKQVAADTSPDQSELHAQPKPKSTDKYQLKNLPTPHSLDLIGRDAEKALLTKEWINRGNRNIVALIAEGGTGKSFLVSRWLAELWNEEPKPYAGAERIFTWSFYSQGSKGQITSSEGFFSDLLSSFGENPENYDSLSRADKALELVCQENMILVLDGVEPLQNPPGHPDAGRFHDRVMGDFVNQLAVQDWQGLAIVTSRQRLAELAAHEDIAVSHVDIQTLEPEDGAELLASLGVTGPEDEIREASKEMGGHAFGLVLLGRYLVDVTGDGDIFKRDHVKLLYTHLDGSEKAKAMLQAYADRFGEESAETAMLHLLGLFDRPVPLAALQKLVAEPVIAGLTDAFHKANAPPLNIVLNRLEELKLITRPPEAKVETVDGHPLVREHFGAQLEKSCPEAWKQAHSRLFDYFCGIPKEDQPDGEAGLLPLYQSLPHGVAAGRAEEARQEVYIQRIGHGGKFYGTQQLGLYSAELAALAAFFPGGWQEMPLQELTKEAQGFFLHVAGFRLQALGRLKEAQQGPYERQVALWIELENHMNSAISSSSLSDLLLVRGELQAALDRANDAVDFIDKTEGKYLQAGYRALRANVLAMQGKFEDAKTLFEEAERRQNEAQSIAPNLYSVSGYFYAAFLLQTEPPSALPGLSERVQATLKIAETQRWLLDIALDRLNLARIAAHLGVKARADLYFDLSPALPGSCLK